MYETCNEINYQEYDNLQVKVIVETTKYDVFPEHRSPTDAQLIVLEGDILFHVDEKLYQLTKQRSFHFPKETKQWVKAKENSKFLVIR